jgi:hypothetical protein
MARPTQLPDIRSLVMIFEMGNASVETKGDTGIQLELNSVGDCKQVSDVFDC